MHYYKRNIGDYAKKAGRLSMLQHGSYTLLLDACYDREQFPTRDEAIEWTWASSAQEIEAVEFVLRKFFTLEDGRYVQKRLQEEIAEYHAKAATNKRIADEREAKRKHSSTNRVPIVDEAPPNHKPLTKNQEPLTIDSVPNGTAAGAAELTKAELWKAGKSLLAEQGMPKAQCGSFVGKLCKDYGDAVVIDAVRATCVARPADAAEYLKAMCLHGAGKRKPAEPEWRTEQRERTQQAAPGVAAYQPADQFFLEVKATDVTPRRLG